MLGRIKNWPRIIYVLVAVIAVILLASIYPLKKDRPAGNELTPHYYKDASRSIADIRIKVFYAVPVNRVAFAYGDWKNLIEPVLKDSVIFHNLQFRGYSKINYELFPKPFVLENESIYYDTEDTNKGNPEGLRKITEEIERREADFLKTGPDEFLAITIIYEGVGASGTDGASILSRTFLSNEQYEPFRSTLFYHEFGHTLGLPDMYDTDNNSPFSNDIMGAGRREPLDATYIDSELLKDMGIN